MKIIEIITICIAVVGIILIILVKEYNKYQWLKIKLNKGETNIYNALEKKHAILLRYIDFLKNNITVNEEEFEEYKLLNLKMPINKLNKKIESMNNTINKYMDDNEKLLKNETIINLNKEILDANIIINGSKKYYNDNLSKYNLLTKKFPSNIVGKLFKYHEKEFLDEIVDNQLKILDE